MKAQNQFLVLGTETKGPISVSVSHPKLLFQRFYYYVFFFFNWSYVFRKAWNLTQIYKNDLKIFDNTIGN